MVIFKSEYSMTFLPRKIKEIKKGHINFYECILFLINIYLSTFFIKSLTNCSFSSAVSET